MLRHSVTPFRLAPVGLHFLNSSTPKKLVGRSLGVLLFVKPLLSHSPKQTWNPKKDPFAGAMFVWQSVSPTAQHVEVSERQAQELAASRSREADLRLGVQESMVPQLPHSVLLLQGSPSIKLS